MKIKELVSLAMVAVAVTMALAGRVSAAPFSAHGPDFAKMMAAMDELKQKSGADFDIAYINSIIPHHQDAIMMAEMVKDDAPHTEVRSAANKIIEDQQKEIEDLTKIMNETYQRQVTPDPRMKMSMSMMDMMRQADATMREKLFLAMMREHHQMALMIGEIVLQKSSNAEIRTQAQPMLVTQKQEQDTFGGYLIGWYTMTPPTPSGDMQHGMDAVMPMAMPPAAPASSGQPSGGTAPNTGATTPATLPRTGGESFPAWLLSFGLLALFIGAAALRRSTR